MTHLILCREFPPAPYPAGGIGTYVRHMAQLLAEAGETVHVITQRWDGAPERISRRHDGKLIVHRIGLHEPIVQGGASPTKAEKALLADLGKSTCPSQLFSWQAARYAEFLISSEVIDVIEAQEWEAPLYYLQVRRAMGLGPAQEPPFVVHLHSPSKMIFEHNEWDTTLTDYAPLSRFEEYSILAADALLCPSRYLAQQVSTVYGVDPGRIEVIAYPLGQTAPLPRSSEVWSRDAVCYVGRLELRKGVLEWVDAAVRAAMVHPALTFDFVGSDTSLDGGAGRSVLATLLERIPQALRSRFHFHGGCSREALFRFLAEAPLTVVPSRWENFPYTCIEAMASGLPVLASPNGGMAELVEDGQSGWVAQDGSAEGLGAALLRALQTTPAQREAMGRRAVEAVQRRCGDALVLAQQLAFRARVAQQGASRSLQVPAKARAARPGHDPAHKGEGLGIVLTCLQDAFGLEQALQTILNQGVPVTTCVVVAETRRIETSPLLERVRAAASTAVLVRHVSGMDVAAAQQRGIATLMAAAPGLRAIAFLDPEARLHRDFAGRCKSVFASQPHVGLVSPWTFTQGRYPDLNTGPHPVALSHIPGEAWHNGCAVRLAALPSPEASDLGSRTSAPESGHLQDWSAVTLPELLVTIQPRPGSTRYKQPPARRYSGMALIQSTSPRLALRWFLSAPLAEKWRSIRRVSAQPKRLLRWTLWQVRHGRAALVPFHPKPKGFPNPSQARGS